MNSGSPSDPAATDFSEAASVPDQHPTPSTPPQDSTAVLHQLLALISRSLGADPPPNVSVPVDIPGVHMWQAAAEQSGLRTRNVRLNHRWWKSDSGSLLGFLKSDGRPVALLPEGNGYQVVDPLGTVSGRVNAAVDSQLERSAVHFVASLPETHSASLWTLMRFSVRPFRRDIAALVVLAMLGSLLAMLTPVATRSLIDQAIPDANVQYLWHLGLGLLAVAVGQIGLSATEAFLEIRVGMGTTVRMQSAVIDRLLQLPAPFFRRYSSGDLMNRSMMVTEVSQQLGTQTVSGILTGVMSLLNLFLCYYYAPRLAWIAVLTALASSVVAAVCFWLIRRLTLEQEQLSGRLFGFAVQLVCGISQLRAAGAEDRAFRQWSVRFGRQLGFSNRIQFIDDCAALLNQLISGLSLLLLFFFSAAVLEQQQANVSVSETVSQGLLSLGTFLAFRGAFDSLVAGAVSLSNTVVDATDIFARRELIRPLLQETPETNADRKSPGALSGHVRISDLVFEYEPGAVRALDHVSLSVDPGEFVAVVGPSGSGKSTLVRMLLGFETPHSGSVSYDHQDLRGLQLAAVRRQIGAVLQHAHINAGSIYDNIALGTGVSQDQVLEAVSDAGFADDVAEMPMGLQTLVSEGAGNLSGGQRQRLLIARALVQNPRIMIFDEATSALDNRTQETVTASISRRSVSRMVIAHRLSTIQQADRIYVLDQGKVVQQGTFDELLADQGLFREMALRQMT